jgi:hypothetical protein
MKYFTILFAFLAGFFSFSCHYTETQFKDTDFSKATIRSELVRLEKGYGFIIWVDEKKYINLNAIPHVDGYKPFPDETVAQQAADMVVQKLRKNIIPPYLSMEDVKQLGLIENIK